MRSPREMWKREPDWALPIEYAMALMLSVADFVKMTSSTSAPIKAATFSRAPS